MSEPTQKVPLVIYGPDGERKVVGESTIEKGENNNDVIINTVVTDPDMIDVLSDVHGLSVGFDPSGEEPEGVPHNVFENNSPRGLHPSQWPPREG